MPKRLFAVISVGLAVALTGCGGGASAPDVSTGGNSGAGSSSSTVSSSATRSSASSSSAGTSSGSSSSSSSSTGPTVASARYVSMSGSDTNPGSSASPWRTIQHAANAANAGDTVYIRGGIYIESVTINVSGSASGGYITFQSYPGETAIVDGAGLTVPASSQNGLINIVDHSYIKILGLEIRNYFASGTSQIPVGVWISGASTDIQILNDHIHDIANTAHSKDANALGLAAYGSNPAIAISNLTIDGNQLDHLTLGSSESLAIDGNVQNWSITNNVIHDNNNIGIDAIGFEAVSASAATDQARDGTISGNTVYNITSYGNPAYGNSYSADGIYCDGCTRVTIERNVVHHADFGVEVASEWPGKLSSYVTVRNNLIYSNNAAGLTIGGYDSGRGGTDHCNVVNNSFYGNDTRNTGAGEFQIQYYSTNNSFKNNILYAGAPNRFIYGYTSSSDVDTDYNLYFSAGGAPAGSWTWKGASVSGFPAYQSTSGKDAHSRFADPLYASLTKPDFHVAAASPAVGAGTTLDPMVVGTVDFAGNPRVKAGNIDIGSYQQ